MASGFNLAVFLCLMSGLLIAESLSIRPYIPWRVPLHRVICEHSQARLYCDKGQVINVYRADYGRRDRITCSTHRPASQIQNVYCSRPTHKVAESCNGKNSCIVRASNSVFGDPCYGTFKYLKVAYTCQSQPITQQQLFHRVICEHSLARLYCYEGQVINVYRADYGRRDRITCSTHRSASQIQNVYCSRPTHKVAESCNGKNSCIIRASNSVFGDPCYGTFKYLEVAYTCLFHRVICEHSRARLYCDKGQVINVYGADYGRRDRITCSTHRPASQIQNVYCSRPTHKVAESCNGKNSCIIRASNSVFGDPCYGTFKYLKVAYTCLYPV